MMRRTSLLLLGGTVAAILAPGCDSRPTMRPETAKAIYEIARANNKPARANEVAFAAMDWSLGNVPFNGSTLPLTSPNGKWLAIETGPLVSPATLLAQPDSEVPEFTGIEIWTIDAIAGRLDPYLKLPPPLLLGSSADAEGFLVEAPRLDGSRWIGKIAWDSGALEWLVKDDNVNAFGTLGPNGELAWCSRGKQDTQFSLVIRFADDSEMGISPRGGEWLLPAWSTRSSRLSVFFLADSGVLSIMSLDARTPELLQDSPRRFDIMPGGRRTDALQARRGQPVIQGLQPPLIEEVIFYHPSQRSVYVWLPMNIRKDPPFGLSESSTTAINDPSSKGYLVSTVRDLRWQDPDNPLAFVRVRYDTAIPRSTTSPRIPYLMFVQDMDELEVRAMVPQAPTSTPQAPAS